MNDLLERNVESLKEAITIWKPDIYLDWFPAMQTRPIEYCKVCGSECNIMIFKHEHACSGKCWEALYRGSKRTTKSSL